jgi:starch synthase (maltosyl-transferring)
MSDPRESRSAEALGHPAQGRSAHGRPTAVGEHPEPARSTSTTAERAFPSAVRRVIVEQVQPAVDEGRFPVKRTIGEHVDVTARIFADGHDAIEARLLDRHLSKDEWRETPMTLAEQGTALWSGQFTTDAPGWHEFAVRAWIDGSRETRSRTFQVWVDRERARFGAWYEIFPRSTSPAPARSGTLRDLCRRLPAIADLGFDVVYLPPIHPIGHSYRKGPNNALDAAPGDPGSPWAIGSEDGGHTAIDPALGSIEDFDAMTAEAGRLGLEIALDLAFQCSPDHPWVREHPEWFRRRADGSIRYAENPPKKYQDIYPLDFAGEAWRSLWDAALDVVRFWMAHGVRIFRVDNPHTKALPFWEWLIGEIHASDPDVVFLSEAFTRPPVMRYLAKAGFSQSYTYFTWRNTKAELTEYFTELTQTGVREYLRPNLFTNTPDILHAYLQKGGRPAFEARLLLAATLGASYGIYSGFELCEARAVPGTEEYLDSEKYQVRHWDWDRPGHIKELIARVNAIRRARPALHADRPLRFCATDNPEIIAYTKYTDDGSDVVLVVVNLDPAHMQHGFVQAPIDLLGLAPGPEALFNARDLMDDTNYVWRGEWNYVRLDPGVRQGHILELGIRN